MILDLYAELAAVADAPDAERPARARDLIRRVATLPAHQRQEWRDALRQVMPGITKGDFDSIVREERRALKEKAKESAAQEQEQRALERREAAARNGRLLPAPGNPMAVARVLAERLPATDDVPHLTWWRGDFYRWSGTRWAAQQDATINRWLYLQTEQAICETVDGVHPWAPTTAKIANLRDALGTAVLARPWEEEEVKCVAVENGVLDVSRGRVLLPHKPQRFNLAALPFEYNPRARCPQWLDFLAEVLPDDREAHTFIGEWFGYIVSGRTDLQKIAHLYGARRSGKGTIARVLEGMLGPELVASPSLASLTGTFGEEPLVGKSLAVISDAYWNTRNIGEAVEILKKISGEDSRDVDRKNRQAWHGRLGVRFMILGNDEPKFTDASGALAGRMIHVPFRVSFFGRENSQLTNQLLDERPGILNWTLDHLDELTARGRFRVPASSLRAEREILRLTSPVVGFIQDRAVYTPNAAPIPLDELYAAYREWAAAEEGRSQVSVKAVFARDLRAAGNGSIQVERKAVNGERGQWVFGLAPLEPGSLQPKQRWIGGVA